MEPDQDLLLFVAAHELVLAEQAAALLKITRQDTVERLERLRAQKLLTPVRLSRQMPAAYRVTPHGAQQIDSALPPLRPLDVGRYRHEIAIGWLWASARHGALGQLRDVLSRREMQSADTTLRSKSLLDTPGASFHVQAPGIGSDARHTYPDLALVQATGGWAALTIILTPPEPDQLKAMIRIRAQDPLTVAQLFLIEENNNTEKLIKKAADLLEASDKVHVQTLKRHGIDGI